MINIKKRTLKRLRIQNEGEIKMRRINKIGIFLSVTFLLILTVPIPVNAQDRDFEEDDILTFGTQSSTKRTVETTDGKTDGSYSLNQDNSILEITDLDSGDKLLDYSTWDSLGNEQETDDYNFDSDRTEFVTLISPWYSVDDNDLILTSLSSPSQMLFIDPQWDDINGNLADNIEDWEITRWVDGADETVDMDDFVSSCASFSLMGESDLDAGLDKFTDTTHRWYGEMTFEGDFYYWDWQDDRYREYDSYEITWELEFTEGGTLKKLQVETKGEDTGKFSFESDMLIQNKAVSLGAGGGLLGGVTSAFEFPIMILAVVSSIVALRFTGKRR